MKNGFYRLEHTGITIALILSIFLFAHHTAIGQLPEQALQQASTFKNFKILDEYPDGRGNVVRTIQYSEGAIRITETIILPQLRTKTGLNRPIAADTVRGDSLLLVINKSHYNIEVFYRRRIIRSYKAVFGPQPLINKCVEGDRCTPEGWFTITDKHPSSKYNKFLGLNYPNDSSIARFNKLKLSGKLPPNAKMGGNVGIHGIWTGGDNMIEMGVGWTDGCIALKNKDVEELFSFVKVGTKVFITK